MGCCESVSGGCEVQPVEAKPLEISTIVIDGDDARDGGVRAIVLPPWSQGFDSLRTYSGQDSFREKASNGHTHKAVPPGADALRDYVDRALLLSELRKKRVRLVRPEFFIKLFRETMLPLPNRQGIPEEGFLDVSALSEEEQQCLEIIAISYCWLDGEHPDPERYHLETIVCLLECFCTSSYDNASASYVIEEGYQVPKQTMKDAFSFAFGAGDKRPVGIFMDWVSLYQDRPMGRTKEQAETFDAARNYMNLWFAHQATTVWALSYLPPDADRAGYHQSGWPTFERAVSAMLTPRSRVLDIGEDFREELVAAKPGACDYARLALSTMDRSRGVPKAPEAFDEAIEGKRFTDEADKDAVVKFQYARTFRAVIADAPVLSFTNVGFGDAECRQLLRVVWEHCGCLRTLDLSLNDIRTPLEDFAKLAARRQTLVSMKLSGNRGLAGDVACLASLTRLRELRLGSTAVTGDVGALGGLTELANLTLGNTRVNGKVGSLAGLMRLAELSLNRTSVSGDVAQLAALTSLTELYLTRTRIAGDVAALASCTRLVELGLGETCISGDVAALRSLAKLARLGLERTAVCGDVAALRGLVKLQVLALYDTTVSGDVASLAGLRQLTTLALTNTRVGGDVAPLAKLQSLTGLYLYGTSVTGDVAGLMQQVQARAAA